MEEDRWLKKDKIIYRTLPTKNTIENSSTKKITGKQQKIPGLFHKKQQFKNEK